MTAPELVGTIESPVTCWLRGYGARELLTSVRRHPPIYGSRLRAWLCQEHTFRDAVALAESQGRRIRITTVAEMERLAGVEVEADRAERAERRGELW